MFRYYLLAINAIGFLSMFTDKNLAVKHKKRISEKSLFLLVLFGGGIGSTIAMYMFHHKTKHIHFMIGFPLLTVIEYVGFLYLGLF